MAGTHQSFSPSTSVMFRAAGMAPVPITLPAVDATNPAVMLQNLGPGPLYVVSGTGSASSGSISGAPNAILLQEGQARMLPTDSGLGLGTLAMLQSLAGGAALQFSRGAVAPVWLFPAPTVAVI